MEIDHYIPENFEEAMEEELSEIEKHKVWTLVPRENGMKVINSKWVYSTKKTSNEGIYKRKARPVAVGCNQRYVVDYKDKLRKCADSLGLAVVTENIPDEPKIEWKKKDSKSRAIINLSIADSQIVHVKNLLTAKAT
ncbi:hypothetical protein LAZ67_2003307 [Cordylochernes scorpioides]|uniref:Reverse transcriptase Ty1/copia-type domain-containing protein n=1 Tax=Cordylochernes scorpioides TaxID=51811 RepID=A0ABY6K2T8_9ARAC|nr:hypothetical protein LAZ67_2003307 [Cordylochernes scorpioides]